MQNNNLRNGAKFSSSSRRRLRREPLQGDVQEEGQGEEWSDAGRHPPRHLPAANVLRPSQIHALTHHVLFTSDFYCINKSFQPTLSSHYQRGSVLPGIARLQWVMFIRAVSESLLLSPIPSSEKTTNSFTRSQDESNFPQANQFFTEERSHLPPADPTARPTTTERGEVKGGLNHHIINHHLQLFPFQS